jgi:hypothetical protein
MAEQTTTSPLPQDRFSLTLRSMRDNPGAFAVGGRIETADFYGNAQTWVVETFRVDGAETVFVQRIDADGGLRLVLPPEITRAMVSQRDRCAAQSRRRQGHRLVAQRKERGDKLGNPEALQKARRRRQAARGGRS